MELSIIEFGVYAFVTYFTLALMVKIIVDNEVPDTKPTSGTRVMFIFPGIVCCSILMFAGPDITLYENSFTTIETRTITQYAENYTGVLNEINRLDTSESNKITLVQPFWITFHFGLLSIMIIYALYLTVQMFIGKSKIREPRQI